MAESDDLCFLIKLDQQQEVKEGEIEKKHGQKEEEKVIEIEETDLQKEAKISRIEETNTMEEAKVSEMDEKHSNDSEKEAKEVSEREEKYTEKEAKVCEMEETVNETEKDTKEAKVRETEDTEKEAKVRHTTEEKISEVEDVSKKKAKVSFKLGLGDDGDIFLSCSDMSFEVTTDNIDTSAQSDSHGSQAATTQRVKKQRKRQSKGGSRHPKLPPQQRGFLSQQFSKKAWLAHQNALHLQEKDKAAAATRYSEEQHLVVFPTAPFNSTQYLMDEHHKNSPPKDWLVSSASNSPKDQPPMPLSPSETNLEAVQFPKRDKEFTDSLISVQAESLQNLPTEELVKHCMHLEEHAAALYKQVAKTENELKQEPDDEEEDVFLEEGEHIDRGFIFESVYNSEANSLSSNNEDFVDFSRVNQNPICVEESSELSCGKPLTPSVSNFSSSESSS